MSGLLRPFERLAFAVRRQAKIPKAKFRTSATDPFNLADPLEPKFWWPTQTLNVVDIEISKRFRFQF